MAIPKQADAVFTNSAEIDMSTSNLWLAVPPERDDVTACEYGTMTNYLNALADSG